MGRCIECSEPARYAGQCLRHYEDVRWSQNVVPAATDECWPWLGLRDRVGYGRFRSNLTSSQKAHRIALLREGRDPGNLKVLHSCDNPPCVNPAHLFVGTLRDNTLDMVSKRRHGTAKATPEQVIEWRSRHERGETFVELATEASLHESTVRRAVRGVYWAHVTLPAVTP